MDNHRVCAQECVWIYKRIGKTLQKIKLFKFQMSLYSFLLLACALVSSASSSTYCNWNHECKNKQCDYQNKVCRDDSPIPGPLDRGYIPLGSRCTYDQDCESAFCDLVSGACQVRLYDSNRKTLPIGSFCQYDYQCVTQRCNNAPSRCEPKS